MRTELSSKNKKKLAGFFSLQQKLSFIKDDVIISSDNAPEGVYFLDHGEVMKKCISSSGTETLMHIFFPGSYFPMTWALADIPNKYDYVARDSAAVYKASKKDFMAFIKVENEILFDLTQRLLWGLNGLLDRTEVLAAGTGQEKVVTSLLYLNKHFGKRFGSGSTFNVKFTHAQIASFAGLARETTTIELARLKDKGFINFRDRFIEISDVNALASILD